MLLFCTAIERARRVGDAAVELTAHARRGDRAELDTRVQHDGLRPRQRDVDVGLQRALLVGVDHRHQVDQLPVAGHPVGDGARRRRGRRLRRRSARRWRCARGRRHGGDRLRRQRRGRRGRRRRRRTRPAPRWSRPAVVVGGARWPTPNRCRRRRGSSPCLTTAMSRIAPATPATHIQRRSMLCRSRRSPRSRRTRRRSGYSS